MKWFALLGLATTLVLTGCQNMGQPRQTQAQITSDAIWQRISTGMRESTQCADQAKSTPSGQKVGNEVLFLGTDDPKRFELSGSKAKLNKAQKSALNQYLADATKCRKYGLDSTSGLPQQTVLVTYYSKMDQIYAGLLSGEMTIGEANKKKMSAFADLQSGMNSANSEMQQNLNNAHNQEISQRQRNAAMLLNYMQGQQVINQNQQLINQNQQAITNQQLQNNKPLNTNCTKYGNQVNCTTY